MKRSLTENELTVKGMNCDVCGRGPVDVHHFRSRGAGGRDSFDNLSPLCRRHHTEFHTIGAKTFYEKYGKQIRQARFLNGMPPIERGKHG